MWGVNNVLLWILWWYDWFMVIYDVYNVNNIGDSGASVIGEGLKVNSTLTELGLYWGVDNVWLRISWWYDWFLIIYNEYNENDIGDSGGSVIGEMLKVNSTLTALNLGMGSW